MLRQKEGGDGRKGAALKGMNECCIEVRYE
jgi:hypothetical protein